MEAVSIMKRFLIVIILMNTNLVFAQTPELLFKSGLESSTTVIDRHVIYGFPYFQITGSDASTGGNWLDDINSIDETRVSVGGGLYGNYDNTFGTDSIAEITSDPDNPGNRVLHYKHNNGVWTGSYWNSSRLSASIMYSQSVSTGFSEGYVKYRMRFSDLSIFEDRAANVDWFMLLETIGYTADNPGCAQYSMYLNLYKDYGVGNKLYWHMGLRDYTCASVTGYIWERNNTDVAVPLESWFTFEMYYKKGNATTGRVIIWITPDGGERTELFNITDYTEDPEYPSAFANDWAVFKLYMSGEYANYASTMGKPVEVWYDNFEYWDGLPVTSQTPPDIVQGLQVVE